MVLRDKAARGCAVLLVPQSLTLRLANGCRYTPDFVTVEDLKTEEDGRMFPVTDDSQTIVDCLMGAARKAGVVIRTNCGVKAVERADPSALVWSRAQMSGCGRGFMPRLLRRRYPVGA